MKNPASSLNIKKKFLILGSGFSGSFFAKTIRQLGCTALTSSRSENKDPNSFVFNSENRIVPDEKIFDEVTHILCCIPPDKHGNDPVLKSLKNKLKSLSLEWVGYLSTTGIYGDTKGDWVSGPTLQIEAAKIRKRMGWVYHKFSGYRRMGKP